MYIVSQETDTETIQALENVDNLNEGDSVRLEARVQPVGDPTLKVHWLKNNQPISQGLFRFQ